MDIAITRQKYWDIVAAASVSADQEKAALKLLKKRGFYEPNNGLFKRAACCTAYYGSSTLMDAMLKLGPVITSPLGDYSQGGTRGNLLHLAASRGNEPAMKSLLRHATPAEINAPNESGVVPLAYAISEHTGKSHEPKSESFLKTARCLNALLDAGADPNIPGQISSQLVAMITHNQTPPDEEAFRKIVRGTNDLEARHQDQNTGADGTPLMLAMTELSWPYVVAMIQEGADATVATGGKPGAYRDLSHGFLKGNRIYLEDYRQTYSAHAAEIATLPLPAMLKRLTVKDGTASPELRAILSLDVAAPLISPDTWRNKPGGVEAGEAFAHQLELLIPENRPVLKGRLDLLPYRRETETPREDSVLISYLRNMPGKER